MAPRKPCLEDYDGVVAVEAISAVDAEMQKLRKTLRKPDLGSDDRSEFSLRLEELQRIRESLKDRKIAESFSEAVDLDTDLIALLTLEEEAAQQDHIMARALQGGRTAPARITYTNPSDVDATILSKLAARHVSVAAGEALLSSAKTDEGSASEKEEDKSQKARRPCVICLDSKAWFELLSVPCGDNYCADCLQTLFRDSYTDESLFPPKCCRQNIPISNPELPLFLPKELRDPYETRLIETTTTDRTYCIGCTKFILPTTIVNHTATCTSCKTTTCSKCKKPAHTGACNRDKNDELALQLAEREGWRRCYQCKRMIELDRGCYHMRCLCGAQFCYRCGEVWKTCRCPQWQERRLYDRARQIVGRGGPAPGRAGRVREVAERLRTEHDCDHENWEYVRGEHQCEECHDVLPVFIWNCAQCHIQVCRRCRRNRFLV